MEIMIMKIYFKILIELLRFLGIVIVCCTLTLLKNFTVMLSKITNLFWEPPAGTPRAWLVWWPWLAAPFALAGRKGCLAAGFPFPLQEGGARSETRRGARERATRSHQERGLQPCSHQQEVSGLYLLARLFGLLIGTPRGAVGCGGRSGKKITNLRIGIFTLFLVLYFLMINKCLSG